MSINNIITDFPGEVGVHPRIVRIETTDSFADITTENYLKIAQAAGYTFYPNDAFLISYGNNSSTTQMFTATISAGNITLVPSSENIALPVTAGKIVQFNDATGTLGEGPVNANVVLTSDITTPDIGSNLFAFNVTATAAQLANGGNVVIIPGSGNKQYRILYMYMNAGGTNFIGGNRLVTVTDGTINYGTIDLSDLQLLVNAPWSISSTAFIMPSGVSASTPTVAGASLVIKYFSGNLDFTNGAVTITGLVQRVA